MRTPWAAVAAALGSVLVLGACTAGSDAPPPARSSSSAQASSTPQPPVTKPAPIDPASVDTSNPEVVAEAVAVASVTWDTTLHDSEFDAARSVTALMTPQLAAAYAPAGPDAHPSTDARWAQARDLHAYAVPDVRTAQDNHAAPPDTATTVYRVYDATWTWHGDGGQTIHDPRTRYLYVTVSQQPDGRWLVSTLDVSDVGG
ncbi:hypothetical protein [Cumulibacter manganitolerans]|uniref:hypothetical protein n=1 Tax=Cumulibacter manganitolerans TaxID=1884992 RepID=UPI001885DAB8|nr:hypothetical protein [Cumulibacter manganitolerans]